MDELKTEQETFYAHLASLLPDIGKYVLIKGADIIGTYGTYEDALQIGYEKFKLEPFLVKRIAPAEQVSYFTRALVGCPA